MTASKEAVLAATPVFHDLDASELAAVAGRCEHRTFPSGTAIFEENSPCEGLYVLAEGSVKICRSCPQGKEIIIDTAPSTVAETPLFDHGTYPASVCAITDLEVLFLSKANFEELFESHPAIGRKVLASVGRRLRHLMDLLNGMSFRSISERLAETILQMEPADRKPFDVASSFPALAANWKTSAEIINRNFERFRAEGWLQVEEGLVSIVDRDQLRKEAGLAIEAAGL